MNLVIEYGILTIFLEADCNTFHILSFQHLDTQDDFMIKNQSFSLRAYVARFARGVSFTFPL